MDLPAAIAVIDDDEAILTGLSSLLRSAGYHARLYTSAEAFLGETLQPLPDCVLTDVQMPKMNGLELQAELKRLHPKLPVIFMTAFPEAAIRERAMNAGAHEFLHKPFEAEAMLHALSTAIRA
jgi:FixJ family two-component response regulator